MREWLLKTLSGLFKSLKNSNKLCKVKQKKREKQFGSYQAPIKAKQKELLALFLRWSKVAQMPSFANITIEFKIKTELTYKDVLHHSRKALRISAAYSSPERNQLEAVVTALKLILKPKTSSHLYSESNYQLKNITICRPTYPDEVEKWMQSYHHPR